VTLKGRMAELAEASAPYFPSASSIFAPRMIAAKSGASLRIATFSAHPAKDRGRVCVLLNGQTEFIEKYFEVIDELRGRGFAVATMDWRGQGGSVRALTNPLKVHVADFKEYDDDLTSLLDQIVKPLSDRPPVGLAHSMGGHNLLRVLHGRPESFACAALCAPMIAVSTRGQPSWLARAVTASMSARNTSSAEFVWGMARRDPLKMTFADQIVTSDADRFRRTRELLERNPEIRLAGPTWGWLEAAFRSMREVRARGYAEAIAAPVLIAGAGHDRICLTSAARAFAARMPRATYVEIEGAEHEILMERDQLRERFWQAFDGFVADYA
jgi:lysophospholipase